MLSSAHTGTVIALCRLHCVASRCYTHYADDYFCLCLRVQNAVLTSTSFVGADVENAVSLNNIITICSTMLLS
jgi:hypothetical protein